jgi:hypothetical protein
VDASGGGAGEVTYVQLFGDDEFSSPLLSSAPAAVVPVSLNRRRKTSTEEIEATLHSIKLDREHIGQHIEIARTLTSSPVKSTGKSVKMLSFSSPGAASAERITNAVHAAVQYMTSPKWYNAVSTPKRRFIRAARRVIRMNLVAKTKTFLAGREKEKVVVPGLSLKGSRKLSTRSREV